MLTLSRFVTRWLAGISGVAICATGVAQGTGQWLPPFNHQHATATATNAKLPFTSAAGPSWPSTFKAVHMSLIPVSDSSAPVSQRHRGKVIVWDQGNTLGFADPFQNGVIYSFQRYAIVDPDPNATTRFFNYFLPLEATPVLPAKDLFCAGHAWSPYGYLVVAGGAQHTVPPYLGEHFVYSYDPRFDNAFFPNTTTPVYPGAGGTRWREEMSLQSDRFYPTLTLTQRFPRPRLSRAARPSSKQCS